MALTTPNSIGQVLKCKSPWTAITTALFIIYVLVTQLPAPKGRSVEDRLTRLESIVPKLENVPVLVATQTEAISTLKVAVDRLTVKVDQHIMKDDK